MTARPLPPGHTRAPASPCPVSRTVYGRPCDGPGTYYCDSEVWGSACRRHFESIRDALTEVAHAAPASDPTTAREAWQDEAVAAFADWDRRDAEQAAEDEAGPQVDDELREAIAEALCRHEFGAEFLSEQTAEWQKHFREGADAVLALPAVQRLLAADAAVKRVREQLAWLNGPHAPQWFSDTQVAALLRRALDGDRP